MPATNTMFVQLHARFVTENNMHSNIHLELNWFVLRVQAATEIARHTSDEELHFRFSMWW